jgi:segregation and condensation protein A
MSLAFQTSLDFADAAEASSDGEALIVELDGYEGPLDVLLALARAQKVDLTRLSVTALAEQYLAFVREAGRRFQLAADYLVMAAWLTYLKSRLLLPRPSADPAASTAEEEAAGLAFRLARLDAMRRAAEALEARPRLGREVFTRGDPEAIRVTSHERLDGDLYALIDAYAGMRQRRQERRYSPPEVNAYRLDEARERLRVLAHRLQRWTALSRLSPSAVEGGPSRASCVASTLSASLELVREGALDARQLAPFDEVYLRGRKAA